MDMHAGEKQVQYANKRTHTFKPNIFLFLFPVCLFQVIPKKRSSSRGKLPFQLTFFFAFFTRKHTYHSFHYPFIHPFTPRSLPCYPFIVLSLVWEREEDRREEEEKEEERKMASFLLVYLSVCLSVIFVKVWLQKEKPYIA